MPPRNITPSSYVGPQVRKFRRKRAWTQQDLADRLEEIGAKSTGWSQTKVNKLERGRLTRVLVDDVFELALALDVSPLYLLTPTEAFDEQENAYKVLVGGQVAAWPREVRQWIRGVRPILGLSLYRSDEDAREGHNFYLLRSQPHSEWNQLVKTGEIAKQMVGVAFALTSDESQEEEPDG
jgi:transcriptional regulator with XRE-family HTH domain